MKGLSCEGFSWGWAGCFAVPYSGNGQWVSFGVVEVDKTIPFGAVSAIAAAL